MRLFGAKIGHGVYVYSGAKIWTPWNIELGDESRFADGVTVYSQGNYLCAGTHDYEQPGFPLITKPIVIGDHAWIAAEAFIHPGVTIGAGAVIGARSVVTKDMPAWMVCAGHPCKPIKERTLRITGS